MKARKPLKAVGSSFDSWLAEQGDSFKADVIAGAMKRQFVMELRAMMKAHGLGVNGLQKLLRTGPSQVQRLLDPEDVGISLKSIAKLLAVFGAAGQIAVELRPPKKRVT